MIKVRCRCDDSLLLSELTEFQGSLKYRSSFDVELIAQSIRDFGFSFPFFVWRDNGVNYVIDGHGRIEALQLLISEGMEIPELPVVYVNAADADAAKNLLLRVNSVYGEIDVDELMALMDAAGADAADLAFPELQVDDLNPEQSIYEPYTDPEIDTSEVDDNDITRAGDRIFDMGRGHDMTEFVCRACGGSFYVRTDVITQYLKGEYI